RARRSGTSGRRCASATTAAKPNGPCEVARDSASRLVPVKIVVLVKEVPDTYGERRLDLDTGLLDRSGDLVIDEINERALEVALLVKDQAKSTEVVVMSLGPDGVKDALRKKLLAMGADRAVHIVDESL